MGSTFLGSHPGLVICDLIAFRSRRDGNLGCSSLDPARNPPPALWVCSAHMPICVAAGFMSTVFVYSCVLHVRAGVYGWGGGGYVCVCADV